MGSTLEGILAYGFDLGGVEDEWHLEGIDEYDTWEHTWEPSWVLSEQVHAGGFEYLAAIEDRLKEAGLNLQVVTYGMTMNYYTGYMLAAWSTTCEGSRTSSVDFPDLLLRRNIERWDDELRRGLKILDITPMQPHPLLLLTQSYG